jgi:hypothetical protein
VAQPPGSLRSAGGGNLQWQAHCPGDLAGGGLISSRRRARSQVNHTRDHRREEVIDLSGGAGRFTWVRFPSPAPLSRQAGRRQPAPARASRASYALIAPSSQAVILSRDGCCRLVPALDSHVGDRRRRSFAGGSCFSKRAFLTGHYRPDADIGRRGRPRHHPTLDPGIRNRITATKVTPAAEVELPPWRRRSYAHPGSPTCRRPATQRCAFPGPPEWRSPTKAGPSHRG